MKYLCNLMLILLLVSRAWAQKQDRDVVYVALSSTPPQLAKGVLSGAPSLEGSPLGAIIYGADPYSFGDRAFGSRAEPNRNDLPITTLPNAIMALDATQAQSVNYAAAPSRQYWLAFDPHGTKLFASTEQQTINVYDTITNALKAQMPAGGIVTDMGLYGSSILAAVMGSEPRVLRIDPTRGALDGFLPIPPGGCGQPRAVTATADGTRVFVASGSSECGRLFAMDGRSARVLAQVPLEALPLGLAITPNGRSLVVTNSKNATVSILDAALLHEIARIGVGITPQRVAVSPNGSKAYVTCKGSNCVSVVHLDALTVSSILVGPNPMGIAITPSGARVVVSCRDNGSVAIIDGNTDTLLKLTSPQPGLNAYGIAVRP